jgi:hypothetical protein
MNYNFIRRYSSFPIGCQRFLLRRYWRQRPSGGQDGALPYGSADGVPPAAASARYSPGGEIQHREGEAGAREPLVQPGRPLPRCTVLSQGRRVPG